MWFITAFNKRVQKSGAFCANFIETFIDHISRLDFSYGRIHLF